MIGPLEDSRDAKAIRHIRRNVFHRMHGKVGFAMLHRNFELLDKQALAADFLQAAIEDFVAARR